MEEVSSSTGEKMIQVKSFSHHTTLCDQNFYFTEPLQPTIRSYLNLNQRLMRFSVNSTVNLKVEDGGGCAQDERTSAIVLLI